MVWSAFASAASAVGKAFHWALSRVLVSTRRRKRFRLDQYQSEVRALQGTPQLPVNPAGGGIEFLANSQACIQRVREFMTRDFRRELPHFEAAIEGLPRVERPAEMRALLRRLAELLANLRATLE